MDESQELKNNSDSMVNWLLSNLKALFHFLNCLGNEDFLLSVFENV